MELKRPVNTITDYSLLTDNKTLVGAINELALNPGTSTTLVIDVTEHGVIGNGIADDTSAVQAVITNAPTGSTIYFPIGTYKITSAILLKSGITILGQDKDKSAIVSYGDIPTMVTRGYNTATLGDSFITLKNIKFADRGVTSKTKYNVYLVNCTNCMVEDVQFNSLDLTQSDVSGLYFKFDIAYYNAGGNSYVNKINRVQTFNASIIMESSDSLISQCEVWAHNRDFAIKLVNSDIHVAQCQIVPSTVHGGIWVVDDRNVSPFDLEMIQLYNNYFDGSWNNIQTGVGILVNNTIKNSSIMNNSFWQLKEDGGININSANSCSIISNNFINCAKDDVNKPDLYIGGSDSCIIQGNTFRRDGTRVNKGRSIHINFSTTGTYVVFNALYNSAAYEGMFIHQNVAAYWDLGMLGTTRAVQSIYRQANPMQGDYFFDTTLGKPVFAKGGGVWCDANGTTITYE